MRKTYIDPITGKFIGEKEAKRRGIKPLRANRKASSSTATALKPKSPSRRRKAKKVSVAAPKRKAAPKSAVAPKRKAAPKSAVAPKRPRVAKPKAKRPSKRGKARAARTSFESRLLPVGSPRPRKPSARPKKGAKPVPGVRRAAGAKSAKRRLPGWYPMSGRGASWAYYENPTKRRRRRKARKSYRRNPDIKGMLKMVGAGGSSFLLSRLACRFVSQKYVNVVDVETPSETTVMLRKWAGVGTSGAILAIGVGLTQKVKKLRAVQMPVVVGAGVSFLEQLIAAVVPRSVSDYVAPPSYLPLEAGAVGAFEQALSGYLPSDVAANVGMGAYLDPSAVSNVGMAGYLPANAAEDVGMGEYINESDLGFFDPENDDNLESDLAGGIFGDIAETEDYGDVSGDDVTEALASGVFGGNVFSG